MEAESAVAAGAGPSHAAVPAPDSAGERRGSGTRARALAFGLVLAGVLAIVLPVRRPPILDLPMVLEQAASAAAILAGERTDQYIAWTGPNQAGVILAGIARGIAPPPWVPRLVVVLVATVWLAAMHFIAARARRPVAAAVLASPFLFSSAFYGGFFNFVAGAAALAFWVWALEPPRRQDAAWRVALTTLAGALLLYWTHLLWLLVGGFAVATCVLLHRFRWQEVVARVAGLVPVALLALAWAGGQGALGRQSGIGVGIAPLDRLASLSVASSLALGGLHHRIEAVLLLAAVGWIALGLVGAARHAWRGVHPFLLTASLVFGAVAVLAPDAVDRTVLFALRWGSFAVVCAILAVPAPEVARRWQAAVGALLALAGGLVTMNTWRGYAQTVLPGFEAALAQVPPGARVGGFDLAAPFPGLRVGASAHLPAYAASERDAAIVFTFADLGNGTVRWADDEARRTDPWFGSWLTSPPRISDLRQFSHVLVRCPPDELSRLAPYAGVLKLVRGSGQWGLLEVAAAPGGAADRAADLLAGQGE